MAAAVAGLERSSGRWGMAAAGEEGSLDRWGMAAAGAGRSYLAAVADRDVRRHLHSCGDLVVEGRRSSRRGPVGCWSHRRRIGRQTGRARKALEGRVRCCRRVRRGGERLPGSHQPGVDRRSRHGGEARSLLVRRRTVVLKEDSPAVGGSLEVGSRLERGSRSSEGTGCMGRTWCDRLLGLSLGAQDSKVICVVWTAVDLTILISRNEE